MTDASYGMNFAADGGDAIHNPTYSTTQNRLQIDLNNPAPLFDNLIISAGTGSSVDFSVAEEISEQLLVINHNLGYVPQVLSVFSLISKSTGLYQGYGLGFALLAEGGAGQDWIDYSINAQTFTINHHNESFGGDTGSYTSTAPDFNLWVKYLICNNPAIQTISIN